MGLRIEVQVKFADLDGPVDHRHIEREAFCKTVARMAIHRIAKEFCGIGHTVEELDCQTLPTGVSRWVVDIPAPPPVKIGPTDI